jgi:spoIIIJ-associated protein
MTGEPALDTQESVALEIVQGLLQHMRIEASVSARHTEPDDMTGKRLLLLDVQGDDLGELIGPRGEVLSDFQFVARLMAGQRLHQRADFLVDVDGYRQRRQQALAKLARRMAGKAVKRGRPVTLEPMSPYDRRIIHLTLRGDDTVYTESTGQGNQRRVRIFPK